LPSLFLFALLPLVLSARATPAQIEELFPQVQFSGNQIGDKALKGWRLNYNHEVKVEFVGDEFFADHSPVLALENPRCDARITLLSAPLTFSEAGRYQATFWAKASPQAAKLTPKNFPTLGVTTFLIRRDWKKCYGQKYLALSNGWLKYDFVFHVPADDIGRPFHLRVDIAGSGKFNLAKPSLHVFQTQKTAVVAEPLQEMARLTFDSDLSMSKGSTTIAPNQAKQAKRVEGFRGQGVTVDDGGRLSYPVAGLLKGQAGTVAVWIRQGHDAPPTFTISDPISLCIYGKNELGKAGKLFSFNTHTPGICTHVYSAYGKLNAGYYRPVKQLFKNEWRHFIFSWDSQVGLRVYVDGALFQESTQKKRFATLARLVPESINLQTATGNNAAETAVMDEIRFYNRALSPTEAEALYHDTVPVCPILLDYAGVVGSKTPYRVKLRRGPKAGPTQVSAVVEDLSGKPVFSQEISVPATAKDSDVYAIDFQPREATDYRLVFVCGKRRIRTFGITAINPESVTAAMPESASGKVRLRLLEKIDCTKEYPAERYLDDGHVSVVDSSIGRYRQANNEEKNSGFAYNFEIKNPGRPHWLEIEYPDDKPRAFYTVIEEELRGHGIVGKKNNYSQCKSLNTIGVANGVNNPVTGKFRTKRLLFWPDSNRIMVGSFVYRPLSGQAGPALKSIRLYENAGPLPRLRITPPEGLPQRSIGSWNEDPTFPAGIWFKRAVANAGPSFALWKEKLKRQVDYLRFTGQNHTNLQVFTYSGANNGDVGVFTQESNSSGYLPGWACLSALTLEREGVQFHVQINDGNESAGLMKMIGYERVSEDFFEAADKGMDAIEMMSADNKLVRGRLNFLHPLVQEAHLQRLRFYREQFGRYETFKGVLILHAAYLTFRDEKTGYGDYTVSLFEKESGLTVPAAQSSLERFAQRYEWLKQHAWTQWLDWRCAKVGEFMRRLAAELNPDGGTQRQLILPFPLNQVASLPALQNGLAAYPTQIDLIQDFRAMGVDLGTLNREPALVVEPASVPNYELLYSRGERFTPNLDSFWYSKSFARLFKDAPQPSLMLSRHANMEVYGWEAPIKKYWWPMGYWGDNGRMMAFSTALPDNKYLPQSLAWNLAHCDPQRIDHGWWGNPENGAVENFQKFYQAYRSIPAVRFTPAPGNNDPVVVREYNAPDGKSGWLYLVNLQYYKVNVKVKLDTKSRKLLDTVANRRKRLWRGVLERELAPYQVVCYRAEKPLKVVSVETKVPNRITADLSRNVAKLNLGARIKPSRQAQELSDSADELLREKGWSALYYLLRSYSARQLLEAADRAVDFTAALIPHENSLEVTVLNHSADSASGDISLLRLPAGLSCSTAKLGFQVKPGTRQVVSFPLKGTPLTSLPATRKIKFALEATSKTFSKPLAFGFLPVVAPPAEKIRVDADLSDWENANWQPFTTCEFDIKFREKSLVYSKTPFAAEYATAWNPEGLWLAMRVKDKDLVDSPDGKSLWQYDSLEIMLDLANDARDGVKKCDDNDCVFFLYPQKGQAAIDLTQTARDQDKALAANCLTAVKRVGDASVYEAFIPAAALKRTALKSGSNIGFALKLNNRDPVSTSQDTWGIMTSSPEYPNGRPDRWNDLLLSAEK
jgi:hypothetical protein